MINQQDIIKMVNDAIARNATNNQFGVSKIPIHTHNRVDSVPVDINSLEYQKGYQSLPNLSTDPVDKIAGSICVVSGKLKVCDGTNWIIVGTQT
jgi:hypothetical protein